MEIRNGFLDFERRIYLENKNLWIHNKGTLFEPTGYAKLNRNLLFEMLQQEARIKFTPCVNEGAPVPIDSKAEAVLRNLYHQVLPDEYVALFNYIPIHFKREENHYNIGLTMFECNRLPIGWENYCNMMDEIWVPSHFNYKTFVESGVKPEKLKVMPLGINVDSFHPSGTEMKIDLKRKYTFLTICSSWDPRKGLETLVEAFFEEFKEDEDVCLIIKTRAANQQEMNDQQKRINQCAIRVSGKVRTSIILITTSESWTDERVSQLYNSADCYVLPTHGEGWNLTAMEAMACELPVITTNWSAHLDFINQKNGYLIDLSGFQPIHAFGTNLTWALPSKEHLKYLMRYVYSHPMEANQKGKLARETVTKQYTCSKTTEKMLNRIREILT
jgi:glycosyltransferase involved in cell wall biosynthesis